MTFISFALWILMWGAAGYFIDRAMQVHEERKRVKQAMEARVKKRTEQSNQSKTADNQVVYNPFVGIL